MIKLFEIPTNEQLIKLANFISEELKEIKKENMSVVFELSDNLIRQIDEEYFFKNNKDETNFIPSDEVQLIVSGVKFKFIKKQNDEENS